jgi:putative transposase
MKYRRANVAGTCYFFTVNLAERNKSLLVEQVDELRLAFKKTRQDHVFDIVAIVVLPDHLHTVWQLPNHDANYSMRWNLIKRRFSRALPKTERISVSRQRGRLGRGTNPNIFINRGNKICIYFKFQGKEKIRLAMPALFA